MIKLKETFALYVRSIVFGIEDSLVSTVGLLSGIAVAGISRNNIIVAGVVLIFVEAFSMGAGSFLSEHSAEHYVEHKEIKLRRFIIAGFLMFVSYFIAGFVPLSPYIFISGNLAFWVSIIFSLVALFILGLISAKIAKVHLLRHSLEMTIIGGLVIAAGVLIGNLFNVF